MKGDGKKKKRLLNAVRRSKITSIAVNQKKKEPGPWVPGTATNLTSMVEVSVSCRDLPNKDLLSKSDPMCVVFWKPPGARKWVPGLRTEMIEDTLDPDFVEKLVMEFRFERVQALRFEVYDVDSGEDDKLDNQDILGFCETTLGQIVGAGESGLILELISVKTTILPIDQNKGPATIILTAEEREVSKLDGINCGTWFLIFPPKMFYAIYKYSDTGKYVIVYRSPQARGTSPNWPQMRMSVSALCKGDYDRELRIDVMQKKSRVGFVVIGSVLTTLNKLTSSENQKLQLMSATGAATKSYIRVQSCTLVKADTFLDYLMHGTRLHTCYAIDFTCSNGDPTDLQSLHFVNASNPNPYEQAIQAVGNILMNYDSMNLYPAFGFGARIPPVGEISYDFPLTLDQKNANCFSVPSVVDNYRKCLRECQLYGPTYFVPVIKKVAKMAAGSKGGLDYYVLIIITDGVITDLPLTKKAIVESAGLPLSIIIIGVGEADFDSMEELDGDAVRVTYRRKRACRDIVQFVPYRSARSWMSSTGEPTELELELPFGAKAEGSTDGGAAPLGDPPATPGSGMSVSSIPAAETSAFDDDFDDRQNNKTTPHQLAQSQLAAEILAEIPNQVVEYMKMKNMTPDSVMNAFVKEKEDAKTLSRVGGQVLSDSSDEGSGSEESEGEGSRKNSKNDLRLDFPLKPKKKKAL